MTPTANSDEARRLTRAAIASGLVVTQKQDEPRTFLAYNPKEPGRLIALWTVDEDKRVTYADVRTQDRLRTFPFFPHGGKSHNLELTEVADALKVHG